MKQIVKSKLLKILKATTTVLLVLFFLLSLFLAIGSIFKNEKQISPWGTGIFTVQTGSMTPAISPGSLVFVRAVAAEKLKVQDIVTFYSQRSNEIVTHRIVSIQPEENIYITRGDANNTDDDPISYENIIGRKMFSLPLVGFLPQIFKDRLIMGMIVAGLGCALLAWGILSALKNKKKSSVAGFCVTEE